MHCEEIIAALAVKYSGDWEKIMYALRRRQLARLDAEDEGEDYRADYKLQPYLDILNRSSYKYVTILSPDYPELLKQREKPPFVLFYYGDWSLIQNFQNNCAVVGSRECTEYGQTVTEEIVKEVAKKYTIVSGMALGVDTVAHQTAMDIGGKTIAVLGSGIDYCYPYDNKLLYKKLKREQLVISEYPGRVPPTHLSFPRRNRIIAAISKGVIVTEAYAKSGTLSTVWFAHEAQRIVMCVPYQAGLGSECNRLISDGGAFLVEDGKRAIELLKSERHLY